MSTYFTTEQIITTARSLMNDKVEPYYVPNEAMLDYLNRSVREAAREVLFAFDAGRLRVNARADDPWVNVLPEVIRLRRLVGVDDPGRVVTPMPYSHIDNQLMVRDYGWRHPARWHTATGDPDHALLDMRQGQWRLVPIPVRDETFTFEGWVYPDALSLDCAHNLPDYVAEQLHVGIMKMAYSTEDADAIYDPRKEANYARLWEAAKQTMRSYVQRDKRDTGRGVRYGGY